MRPVGIILVGLIILLRGIEPFVWLPGTIILYSTIIKNTNNMYSLDCPYFEKYFKTVNELISYIIESGMDPNYEITWEDDGIGELAIDYISF